MSHTSREGFILFILSRLSSLLPFTALRNIDCFAQLTKKKKKKKITLFFLQFYIRHHLLQVAGVENHLHQHKQSEFYTILKPSFQCLVQWH